MEIAEFIRQTLNILFDLLTVFIVLRVILSWFQHQTYENQAFSLSRFVFGVTEPILLPIRRVIPHLGIFDISPLVALLLLDLLRSLINTYL